MATDKIKIVKASFNEEFVERYNESLIKLELRKSDEIRDLMINTIEKAENKYNMQYRIFNVRYKDSSGFGHGIGVYFDTIDKYDDIPIFMLDHNMNQCFIYDKKIKEYFTFYLEDFKDEEIKKNPHLN